MSFLKKVNSGVNSLNTYLNKYLESSQFEKHLKESLNNKNYGVANSILYELSISTYDVNYYRRVVEEVFKAIQEKPTKWRKIYKGLRLCEYVMKHGCEYFISEVKQNEELIKKLTHFTHLEELKDRGAGIREICANILKMLKDNQYLENERKAAALSTKLYTHIESTPLKKKKSFFGLRKEKRKNLKYKMSDPYIKPQPELLSRKAFTSQSVFDEILRERNLMHEEEKRLHNYRNSTYWRRSNSPKRYFSGLSSEISSSYSHMEKAHMRNKSDDERIKKRRKERRKSRKRNNSYSGTSRSSSPLNSEYSSHASSSFSRSQTSRSYNSKGSSNVENSFSSASSSSSSSSSPASTRSSYRQRKHKYSASGSFSSRSSYLSSSSSQPRSAYSTSHSSRSRSLCSSSNSSRLFSHSSALTSNASNSVPVTPFSQRAASYSISPRSSYRTKKKH